MFALGNFVEIRIIPACFCLAFKHYISRAYELETNMCIMTLSTAPAPPSHTVGVSEADWH